MKRNVVLGLLSCVLYSNCSFSEPKIVGIYKNLADYESNNLAYKNDNSGKRTKIMLNDFFEKPTIKIITDNKNVILDKSAIYGYVDNNNNTYRFFEGEHYQLLEKGIINIYSRLLAEKQGREGFILVQQLFFSTSDSTEILPLNIENMDKALSKVLSSQVCSRFTNASISNYNSAQKSFDINITLKNITIKQ